MTKMEWLIKHGYHQDTYKDWKYLKPYKDTNIQLVISINIMDFCCLEVEKYIPVWTLYKDGYIELGKAMEEVEDDLSAMWEECE